MTELTARLTLWRPQVLSLLRIVSGLIFWAHGTAKILGFPVLAPERIPSAWSLSWIAGVLELILGVFLILGFKTRYAAFVASGLCAFAYFIGHAGRSFFPILNGGEGAILYCFVFLYLVVAGPGPWSVDATRGEE